MIFLDIVDVVDEGRFFRPMQLLRAHQSSQTKVSRADISSHQRHLQSCNSSFCTDSFFCITDIWHFNLIIVYLHVSLDSLNLFLKINSRFCIKRIFVVVNGNPEKFFSACFSDARAKLTA